jgi:PKD repeat protein
VKVKQKVKLKNFLFFVLILILVFFQDFCKKAVLTAPDNTTLVVTVNPPVIPLGGQAVVRVMGYKASGTPVPDGTVIFFSTDIGTIESRKETLSGAVEVLFQSNDNRSGVATITVTSGNATVTPETLTITIGTSGLNSLSLTADPPVLPLGGGVCTLRVTAYDENFNPLANIPVTLSTNAGTLNNSGNVIITNANGVALDQLTTTVTTEVTAFSGGVESSITVNVETNEGPTAAFVFSPQSPSIDETVYFNASESSDTDGSIVLYQWTFGDGHGGSGETVTHKYREAGAFTVVLVVEDNSGNRDTTSQTINISEGESPTASFVFSPTNPSVNEIIYFNASESSDEDGNIVSFEWDFGDGTFGSGDTVTHQYSDNGSFTVLLKVVDNDNNIDIATQTITIGENEKPVASFSYSPSNPLVNQDIYFNASDSSDPDGTIVKYEWDMGNGTTASGVAITYRYASDGTYTVYLRVTDNSGNTDSTTQNITVSANQNPTAAFIFSPTTPTTGERVHFNASESTDPDGTIVSWEWDFGDSRHGSGEEVNHTYADPATYTVVLVVTDDSGNSDILSKTITVIDNNTPVASFTISPSSPNVGEAVTFDASASYDPDGGELSLYDWSFGEDGNTGNGRIATYTYNKTGTVTISLTVTDDEGVTANTTRTVTVN